MGKIKGSHRGDGSSKKGAASESPKRQRRNEGPAPTGRQVAMRNAGKFIKSQDYKRNTGQSESDLRRGTSRDG